MNDLELSARAPLVDKLQKCRKEKDELIDTLRYIAKLAESSNYWAIEIHAKNAIRKATPQQSHMEEESNDH